MGETYPLGGKLRDLRRRANMTQAQLADQLGISASYVNLLERNRRPVTAALLIRIAELFQLELKSLSGEEESRLMADLMQALDDPLFDTHSISTTELRDCVSASLAAARAFRDLYRAYRSTAESLQVLTSRAADIDEHSSVDSWRLPSEEVSDLIQRHMNYFPDLEEGAEALWREALAGPDLASRLVEHLEGTLGVTVRIETTAAMSGAVRRYDPTTRVLTLSEVLRRGSRNFHLAHQIGLLTQRDVLDRLAADPLLTTDESRALARVALANYFAGAVLLPYAAFLEAACTERYDIELLCHRFRTSFEQTCHRFTTLRRPGAEGVPMHMVRIDVAGNISKRFSASGLRFARFSGACPRWVAFAAFLTPGLIRTQIAQMPDGSRFFWIARTVARERAGYHTPDTVHAIGIGCDVRDARALVYADGVDPEDRNAALPVGPTCRFCERLDCEQRAFPTIQHPLRIDENVRGVSFYAPVKPR